MNDPIDGGRLRVWCDAGTPRARQTAFAVGVASFAILLAACDAARDGTTPTAFADALIDLTGTAPAELPRADSFIAMGLDQQGVAALLTDVRGIAITNRGNVWVADRDMAIRVFDRDGNFLRRVGRPGSGPGEFREISWIRASGDGNILALDMPNGRVTEFEADGTVAATHNVMPVGLIFDITADRDLLGVPMPAGEMRSEDGTRWADVLYYRMPLHTTGSTSPDTIGRFAPFRCADDPPNLCVPAGSSPGVRAYGSNAMVYDRRHDEILIRDMAGRELLRVRVPPAGDPEDLFADDSGRIWLETADVDAGLRVWHRIDPATGEYATRKVGTGEDLAGVYDGRLVWVNRDSLGVLTVRMERAEHRPRP